MSSKYSTPLYKIYHFVASLPGKIRWGGEKTYAITSKQKEEIAKKLAAGYYIILTGRRNNVASIIISFLTLVKTGRWGRYTHALMNCDNITDPTDTKSFKFLEATGKGVDYATFDQIFACDTVCLLTPINVSNEEWTAVIDGLLSQHGLKYDDLFDLADKSRVSCVELVLNALMKSDYSNDFANLDAMIKKTKNLVPEMFRRCPDFRVDIEF